MGKFNVGDKVRIVSKRGACWNFKGEMDHWCNKVMTIRETISGGNLYLMEEDKHENGGNGWCWGNQDIVGIVNPEKIVITHDGKTTTATLYKADGSKEKATARCAPEDTFDFNFGANLAMERLMEKVTPVTVNGFKIGDRVNYNGVNGTIICFAVSGYDNIGIEFDDCKEFNENIGWGHRCGGVALKAGKEADQSHTATCRWKAAHEINLGEIVKPKRYNGKVVCVGNTSGNSCLYTVGKIYQFVDGSFTADDGSQSCNWNGRHFESFEEWKKFSSSKWIEIVE